MNGVTGGSEFRARLELGRAILIATLVAVLVLSGLTGVITLGSRTAAVKTAPGGVQAAAPDRPASPRRGARRVGGGPPATCLACSSPRAARRSARATLRASPGVRTA